MKVYINWNQDLMDTMVYKNERVGVTRIEEVGLDKRAEEGSDECEFL
jgi:hypothetical protein